MMVTNAQMLFTVETTKDDRDMEKQLDSYQQRV